MAGSHQVKNNLKNRDLGHTHTKTINNMSEIWEPPKTTNVNLVGRFQIPKWKLPNKQTSTGLPVFKSDLNF